MQMYFHFAVKETVLFKAWVTDSEPKLLFTCVLFFVLAIAYEKIKATRAGLNRYCPSGHSPVSTQETTHVEDSPQGTPTTGQREYRLSARGKVHLLDTLLYLLQFALGYSFMLAVMTFNGWIFLSVVFGAAFGHLLFGDYSSLSAVGGGDHCT